MNIPLEGSVARGSVGLAVSLDDEIVDGARGQQGYIRNSNGHRFSSIHFSGVINATEGQVLKVETSQLAKAGTIKVQNGKTASIFIEKLGDDGVFSDAFNTTSAEEAPENLNPNAKASLALDEGRVNLSPTSMRLIMPMKETPRNKLSSRRRVIIS